MELTHEIITSDPQVILLHVAGRIDGSSYLSLVDQARDFLGDGTDVLLLDLTDCNYLSSAGLFALHNIALLAHHYKPLDQEDGWGAIRQMANEQRTLGERFKILGAQPNILHTLEIAGLASLYAIYPDLQSALVTFEPVNS